MEKILVNAASGLAKRTSRRGFLGRGGQLLLGVVGGSALLGLMAGEAQATHRCHKWRVNNDCCLHWYACICSNGKVKAKIYDCPRGRCGNDPLCWYWVCTSTKCPAP
jgi:hypothetical protein